MEKPRVNFEQTQPGTIAEIYDDEDHFLQGRHLDQLTWPAVLLVHPMFEQVFLDHVQFSQSQFERLEITDAVITNCDFSNCQLEQAMFYRVTFKNCKLLGTNLDQAVLNQVTFEDCRLDLAALTQLRTKQVVFKRCSLKSASFTDNQTPKVTFNQTDLDDLLVTGTWLKNIDLRSCTFDKLSIGEREARGVRVTTEQAATLAALLLGVRVD